MVKKMLIYLFAGILLGAVCAGVIAGKLYGGRSPGEVAELDRRYDYLVGEYTSRQRIIEYCTDECLDYVEAARAIASRTGENAGRAVSNLRDAAELIKQGIAERENLNLELSRIRSGLYRIRDMAGVEAE